MGVAKSISDYLLTGMHHSTPEGQAAISSIIAERLAKLALVERTAAVCADSYFGEWKHEERAKLCDELVRTL